jgi:hypothetical protein
MFITILKVIGIFLLLVVIIIVLHLADYAGHWLAWRGFGDSHFQHCTCGKNCPVIHLKSSSIEEINKRMLER